jgi:hypothetical protein
MAVTQIMAVQATSAMVGFIIYLLLSPTRIVRSM